MADVAAEKILEIREGRDLEPPYPPSDGFPQTFHEYELEMELLRWATSKGPKVSAF